MRHALPKIGADALAEAYRVHEECQEAVAAEDRLRIRRLNYRFHFIFYEAANRPQTLEFVRVLWAKYPFHDLDAIEQRQARMQAEHAAFLERVAAKDHKGALRAMEEHIRKGWGEFAGGRERTHQADAGVEVPPPGRLGKG